MYTYDIYLQTEPSVYTSFSKRTYNMNTVSNIILHNNNEYCAECYTLLVKPG